MSCPAALNPPSIAYLFADPQPAINKPITDNTEIAVM